MNEIIEIDIDSDDISNIPADVIAAGDRGIAQARADLGLAPAAISSIPSVPTRTEHTPGPWKHIPYQYVGAAQSMSIVVADANEAHCGCIIANVSAPPHRDGYIPTRMAQERIANARLIAAAPDLYDALSRVGDVLEIWEAEDDLVKTTASAVALASCIRAALAKATGESKKS